MGMVRGRVSAGWRAATTGRGTGRITIGRDLNHEPQVPFARGALDEARIDAGALSARCARAVIAHSARVISTNRRVSTIPATFS